MKNYFITFFLNNRGEKELSLVKVEDDDSKSKEFPYSVTTYSSSDDSVGYSLVTKFTDNRNFSSNYPISKQLSPGSSFGEFYCVEIPSSMFKAIESLYNELFRAFEDSFERNIGKNKEGLNDGQTSSNDFMKGERVNKSLEVEFVECMDYGVYTFFDFRSEPDSPKILRRGFVNNPRKEAECRKQYQSLSNRAVAELNEIFNEKREVICEALEFLYDTKADKSIDDIVGEFWEREERKYNRYMEERDNYDRWEEDNYSSWGEEDEW